MLVFTFVQLFLVLILLPPAVLHLHGVKDLTAPAYRTIFTLGFMDLVIFGSLGFLMWKGYNFARWVTSFLLFAMAFLALTYTSDVTGNARLTLIGGVLYQLVLAAFLAFSQTIDQFIREQERNRLINL